MIIDVHAHYIPKAYRKALSELGLTRPEGWKTPDWDPELHLEIMDRMGIDVAMLSISSPSIYLGDDAAACALAREVNEAGAALVKDYPGRFGLFASLPVPCVDAALAEMAYAFDVLKADGIVMTTNYNGLYLGDDRLEPIFAELGRRKAVLYLHPTKPGAVPENVMEGFPIPAMEYLFDTTRTVANLIIKGTLERNPGIKLIVPHGGAALSILADRIVGTFKHLIDNGYATSAPDILGSLRSLYYELAGHPIPNQLAALLHLVGTDRLLYGSDVPYAANSHLRLEKIHNTDLLSDEQRKAIFQHNPLTLFPRLVQIKNFN